MIRVKSGAENLSPMEHNERDFLETMAARPDERLACQCRVKGDVVLEVSE
jgi:ferredoxin